MSTIASRLVFAFTLILDPCAEAQNKLDLPKGIKSHCLDFNRAERGGFAEPAP